MLISIVIPCYYSEKTIDKVVEMTIKEFESREGYSCEFVLINDGSVDGTYERIYQLGEKYSFVKGINLLRNFGQHNALMAGLHYVQGEYVLGMDDDMQTHPSQIFKLIDAIRNEDYDLVYGKYVNCENSALKNLTSRLNRATSQILLGRPKHIVSSNFWIISKKVAEEVIKYDSYNPYVDGIFYRVTHKIGNVDVEHFKREVGTSNYTLGKLMKLWLAYFNYSVIPLRISSMLGMIMAGVGFLFTLVTIIRKIVNPDMLTGWTSIICLMLIFFGMVLVGLGIIGEYLGKILLTINHTPQYIVRDAVNVGNEHE